MDTAVPVAAGRGLRHGALPALALAGAAATLAAAALGYAGAAGQPGLTALARGLIVGAPVAIGLYAWSRRPSQRFGLLLMAAGGLWFLATLSESADPTVYTVGRTAGWLAELYLVYLVLCFPTGRLLEAADRRLVQAMAAVVAIFYLPQLVVAETFPVPSPYTSCIDDCPPNALFALDSQPAFVQSVMRPLGAVLVLVVMTAVVLRLYGRMRRSTPLTRRMLAPVVGVAVARAAALGIAIVGRELDRDAWPIQLAAWLLALAVPAVAIAFLVGLLRWRLFAETALRRLAECLRALPDALTLRRAFAEAFGDPTIKIVFPGVAPDRWMDPWGRPADVPGPDRGRAITEVRRHGTVVAAIVHDEGLRERPELLEAGASMAAVVLENQRLAAEAELAMRELQLSRARIAAGAEHERRRIERDLHDGAQQRLVALRIELELAEEIVRQDPERGVERLRELEHEVEEALDELRALAHGVYPSALADRGLDAALRDAAMRSQIRVDVVSHDVGRFSTEVEGAIYFCVLEAIQNAHKHADGARRIVVTLDGSAGDRLRFSVRDDGRGTDVITAGAGITNMHDRLAAIGGEVDVASRLGVGTVVRGEAPVRRPQLT
jgi:signal transduction histidine kinase